MPIAKSTARIFLYPTRTVRAASNDQMAPKVPSNEVSLGTNVDDGKIVFGVVQ